MALNLTELSSDSDSETRSVSDDLLFQLMATAESYIALKKYQEIINTNSEIMEILLSNYHSEYKAHVHFIPNILYQSGDASYKLGNYDEALERMNSSLEWLNTTYSECNCYNEQQYYNERAKRLTYIGMAHAKLGNYEDALENTMLGLELWEKKVYVQQPAHQDILDCLDNISMLHQMFGHPIEQINTMTIRLERLKITSGHRENDLDSASQSSEISLSYMYLGRYKEALNYMKNAMNLFAQVYSKDHTTVAKCLEYVSLIQGKMGKFEDALVSANQSIKILHNIFGPNNHNHGEFVSAFNVASIAYRNLGYLHIAIGFAQQSLAIINSSFMPSYESYKEIADCYKNIGLVYQDLDINIWAELQLIQSLNIREKTYLTWKHNNSAEELAQSLYDLGIFYKKLSNYTLSAEYFEKSLKLRKELFPSIPHPDISINLGILGFIYLKSGFYAEAIECIQENLKIKVALPEEHRDLSNTIINLGNIAFAYAQLGNTEHAFKKYREALKLITDIGRTNSALAKPIISDFAYFLQWHLGLSLDKYPDNEIIAYELKCPSSLTLSNMQYLAYLYQIKAIEKPINGLYINKAAQFYKKIFESEEIIDSTTKTIISFKNSMLLLGNDFGYEIEFKQKLLDSLEESMRTEQNKFYLSLDIPDKQILSKTLDESLKTQENIIVDSCTFAAYLLILLCIEFQLSGWDEKTVNALNEFQLMLTTADNDNVDNLVSHTLYNHAAQAAKDIGISELLRQTSTGWVARIKKEEEQKSNSSYLSK